MTGWVAHRGRWRPGLLPGDVPVHRPATEAQRAVPERAQQVRHGPALGEAREAGQRGGLERQPEEVAPARDRPGLRSRRATVAARSAAAGAAGAQRRPAASRAGDRPQQCELGGGAARLPVQACPGPGRSPAAAHARPAAKAATSSSAGEPPRCGSALPPPLLWIRSILKRHRSREAGARWAIRPAPAAGRRALVPVGRRGAPADRPRTLSEPPAATPESRPAR